MALSTHSQTTRESNTMNLSIELHHVTKIEIEPTVGNSYRTLDLTITNEAGEKQTIILFGDTEIPQVQFTPIALKA